MGRTPLIVAIVVLTNLPLAAQEPVVGVKDAEKLFADTDRKLHRNKQATLHIMRELMQCGHWDRAGEWLTSRYIQHNPNAISGLQGVVAFFTNVVQPKRVSPCPALRAEVVAVVADGDYVTVMVPRRYPDPRKAGATYSSTWFDTWRFVDGKADEHWDPDTVRLPPPAAR
jgi:predicted SnoaL-like aldol condensation-catalyzing enzyme